MPQGTLCAVIGLARPLNDGFVWYPLRTAYGDGWGFDPRVPEKLSMGFARITGGPTDFAGENIRSGTDIVVSLSLAPGGGAIVVCDVASSTGYPELLEMRREKLPEFLDRLAYTDRGFDGLGLRGNASSPITAWKSRTMRGYGSGPTTEPMM